MINDATSEDVFNYLSHLKDIKRRMGKNYKISKDEEINIFYNESNIPVFSCTDKIFEIFEELKV